MISGEAHANEIEAIQSYVYPLTDCNVDAQFETIPKKICYKSYGLSEDDIFSSFEKAPKIVAIYKEKITKGFSFYHENLHWDATFIITHPIIFLMSIEKGIAPRLTLHNKLMSKNFLRNDSTITPSFFHLNKKEFKARFLVPFKKEHPEVNFSIGHQTMLFFSF